MRLISPDKLFSMGVPSRLSGTLTVYESLDDIPNDSTHLIGHLDGITYHDLVLALGEPTYSTPSLDDKVQKEWVVEFVPKHGASKDKILVFRIYDWKTGSEFHTMNFLESWSIGGEREHGANIVETSDFREVLTFMLGSVKNEEESNP